MPTTWLGSKKILQATKRLFQHFSVVFFACCGLRMLLLKRRIKIEKGTFYQEGLCLLSSRLWKPCKNDSGYSHDILTLPPRFFCFFGDTVAFPGIIIEAHVHIVPIHWQGFTQNQLVTSIFQLTKMAFS